ncbi:MAG: endonuclease/exonuclease/phosphatase family protein [Flavobacteriales bacterium]
MSFRWVRVLLFFLPFLLFACTEKWSLNRNLKEDKQYQPICVGFYNVENLFDTLDTKDTEDSEYTPEGANSWNTERYEEKLSHLARVISELGTEKTPHGAAVLGLAEVENRRVLEDLVETEPIANRDYRIAHHQSPDERGIDVALLYRPEYFKVSAQKSFEVELPKGDKTRDQLLVSGKLRGERVHFMVAHWPSRSGGQAQSEPHRIAAAQTGKKVLDSIRKAESDPKIIYMGDLNDDPINKSVQKVLKAKGSPQDLQNGELFNPMRKYYEKGIGTLAWKDNWNLFDQILVSKSYVEDGLDSFRYYEAHVHNKEYLKQKKGNFKGYPLRSYVGSTYKGGYSDHFPVYIYLIRKSKSEANGKE